MPKINLTALARSQALSAAHPVEGDIEEDDDIEEQEEGIIGRRGVDLSGLDLKADHAARPLWVDEHGNMYVPYYAIYSSGYKWCPAGVCMMLQEHK